MKDVTWGYIVDGVFLTRMNYNYQSPDDTLPEGVVGTDEEVQAYLDEDSDREVCRTNDGKIFLNYKTAVDYAKTLVIPELNEVIELLNKAKFLAEKNKKSTPVLESIADALGSVISNPDELMEKYYDSTC